MRLAPPKLAIVTLSPNQTVKYVPSGVYGVIAPEMPERRTPALRDALRHFAESNSAADTKEK